MRRPRPSAYLIAAGGLVAGSLLEQYGRRRRDRLGRWCGLLDVDGDEQGYPPGVHSWSALIDWGRGR